VLVKLIYGITPVNVYAFEYFISPVTILRNFALLFTTRHTRFLIVGQGLCGSWLSWYLRQAGADFLVMDDNRNSTASKMASGIINPVTGRRFVTTWMAETLLPFCTEAYAQAGEFFQQAFITECPVLDFFPTAQMRVAFASRTTEADNEFLRLGEEDARWRQHVNFELGYGSINPVYQVMVNEFLTAQRQLLLHEDKLVEDIFDPAALEIKPNGILYKGITAEKIIFCNGVAAAQSPWFNLLPFAFNKGELLLVAIKDLPRHFIYKQGMSIVPFDNELFWVGSTYEWEFENDQPTEAFRDKATAWLRHFVKAPFEVAGHYAALRPATIERRPFAGLHPVHKALGILNGMGTKGVSLAPYFGRQLALHLTQGAPVQPDVDVKRFTRILSR
jgi:glycine/D-amino acid oxidase-like deaminating enzyme